MQQVQHANQPFCFLAPHYRPILLFVPQLRGSVQLLRGTVCATRGCVQVLWGSGYRK